MSTVAKILVVVNLVLAGAFLASASNHLGQQETWKTKHDAAVADYEQKLAEKDKVNASLKATNDALVAEDNDIKQSNSALKKENETVRAQNDLLKTGITEFQSQNDRLTAAVQTAQETIKSLRDMNAGLQNERATLADQVRAALDQKEAAIRSRNETEVQNETLLATKQQLESNIEDLKTQLNSAHLTAENALSNGGGAAGTAMDQPAQTGMVLMSDPSTNVAVISLGAEDGVRRGFRYTVSRGSQYVTTLEITDVEAKQSAGRSVKDLQKSPIQKGDRVMSR